MQSFAAVQTASLVPPALEGIPTGDEFISRLPEFDAQFSKLRADASAEGKVLRFVGVVDAVNGQVKAGLEKYVLGLILVSNTYSGMSEPGIPLITPLPLR